MPRMTRLSRVLGLLAAAGIALPLLAQSEPAKEPAKEPIGPMTIEPAPRPQPESPRPVVVPGTAQPTLAPVRPGLPPPAAADLGLPSVPALLREGSYITNAKGQIVRGKSGRWYVIFDQETGGRALPPMILAENANLAAMERSVERLPEGTRYRIAGRVTVYRDRNYLLPSMPPLVERIPTAAAATPAPTVPTPAAPAPAAIDTNKPAAASDSDAAPKPATGSSTDPSVEQIIAELDKAVGPARPRPSQLIDVTQPSAGTQTPDGGESDGRIALTGFLANRRARIVRTDDGRLAARLDGGADGHTEGPMILLPCQNLAGIDAVLDTQGEAASFTLSGEVVVYKGRNYLLPSMYVVNRATDIVMPTH